MRNWVQRLSALEGFLIGSSVVLLTVLIINAIAIVEATPVMQPLTETKTPLPCIQDAPAPTPPPATSCDGLISKAVCADTCKELVQKQAVLHRGLPAFISHREGDYHVGEYVVSWVDCRRMFFVGHPTSNAEIPVLFHWPQSSCACDPRAMRLNMQENYVCTTVQ